MIADNGEKMNNEGTEMAESISREKMPSELISKKEASSCSTAADAAEILVMGGDGYRYIRCGAFAKLRGEMSELKEELSELKEARQRHNVRLAVGELVTIVYQKIFEIAKETGLPEVLGRRGQRVDIDLPMFLRFTKSKAEFKALLDAVLVEIGLSKKEYDILVATKQTRTYAYHPTDILESLKVLETVPVDDFSDARNVLLSHRAMFNDDIDEYTPTDTY